MLTPKRGLNTSGDYKHGGILAEATSEGKEVTPGTSTPYHRGGLQFHSLLGRFWGPKGESEHRHLLC